MSPVGCHREVVGLGCSRSGLCRGSPQVGPTGCGRHRCRAACSAARELWRPIPRGAFQGRHIVNHRVHSRIVAVRIRHQARRHGTGARCPICWRSRHCLGRPRGRSGGLNRCRHLLRRCGRVLSCSCSTALRYCARHIGRFRGKLLCELHHRQLLPGQVVPQPHRAITSRGRQRHMVVDPFHEHHCSHKGLMAQAVALDLVRPLQRGRRQYTDAHFVVPVPADHVFIIRRYRQRRHRTAVVTKQRRCITIVHSRNSDITKLVGHKYVRPVPCEGCRGGFLHRFERASNRPSRSTPQGAGLAVVHRQQPIPFGVKSDCPDSSSMLRGRFQVHWLGQPCARDG
mmetsp:Transcript_8357/g.25037  ORF Transcript_8357/g.25037 Transcript_8357/m.25037 type:complete len:341 (+) Transcript_8357:4784-5806(+)